MYKHYDGLDAVQDVPAVKVFNNAEDKNVAAVMLYANTSKALFYDEAFTKEVPASDCLNLFLKGCVCKYNNAYYIPTECTAAGVMTFAFS